MYAEFLRYKGFTPICVSNAAHALTIAPDADVIVTALRLPGPIGGLELIANIRSHEHTMRIPIVVLTACAWTTERVHAETAGCDLFLSKPCLPDQLVRELRRMLALSRARRMRAKSSTAPLAVR